MTAIIRRDATTTASSIPHELSRDPSITKRRQERIVVGVGRMLVLVVVLGGWQLVSGRLVSTFWIASPSTVWNELHQWASDGTLTKAIRATLVETVVGFALGSAAAVVVGLALGINRVVARIVDPFLVALNSVPRVALVPLMIVWFGIGFETKVLFASLLVFFPVFMNTLAGARDVDADLIDVLRVMGARRLEIVWKVVVPSSLAWVFAGLRMSIPFALIGAVMAEMFTSNSGLGYLISKSANLYDTPGTFAALFVTTLLGLVLNGVVSFIERFLLRWQRSQH